MAEFYPNFDARYLGPLGIVTGIFFFKRKIYSRTINCELLKKFCPGQFFLQPLKDTSEKGKKRRFLQILLIKIQIFFATQRPLGALEIPPKKKKFAMKNFRLEPRRNLGGPKGVKTLTPPSSANKGARKLKFCMVTPLPYRYKWPEFGKVSWFWVPHHWRGYQKTVC